MKRMIVIGLIVFMLAGAVVVRQQGQSGAGIGALAAAWSVRCVAGNKCPDRAVIGAGIGLCARLHHRQRVWTSTTSSR
jgi:hypothetical protein